MSKNLLTRWTGHKAMSICCDHRRLAADSKLRREPRAVGSMVQGTATCSRTVGSVTEKLEDDFRKRNAGAHGSEQGSHGLRSVASALESDATEAAGAVRLCEVDRRGDSRTEPRTMGL